MKLTNRVMHDRSTSGQTLWVQVTVRNRTGKPLGGRQWTAEGIRREPPRTLAALDWGGSSADDIWAAEQASRAHARTGDGAL